MYKIMTPGPTQVAENVRLARSKECTNPDLDTDFVEFYKETCEEISRLLHTENETLILGGEGILGLEAACASMTEPGDRVLVLDNGIYGRGFADFVSMYGGKPELYSRDYRETLDVQELENFLKDHHNYSMCYTFCTVRWNIAHCDASFLSSVEVNIIISSTSFYNEFH